MDKIAQIKRREMGEPLVGEPNRANLCLFPLFLDRLFDT
jgi:hypothetical protein